ncbi:MAG: peptidoglycan editing factor PgeF [Marinobacter sp.]
MNSDLPLIAPVWPAPASVQAFNSTRQGGVSAAPWDQLNLGDHVNDHPRHVAANRQRLADHLGLPAQRFAWLNQVHGTVVVEVTAQNLSQLPPADASYTREPGTVCAILTADCLPVILCDRQGTIVGAAHAGWRSLCGGVLENLITAMGEPAENLMAWLGPAIGTDQFEVGPEVRQAFINHSPQASSAFASQGARPGRYMADIYQLAKQRLQQAGVSSIDGGGLCTVSDSQRFYSYRRDGQTGRMATLIAFY